MILISDLPSPSILGGFFFNPGKKQLFMKWHKKMTDHLDDPFIQELIYKFGANGYMVYFGVISLICRENKNQITGEATFPGRYLKEKFHISVGKVEEILGFCQGKGKLLFNFHEKNFNFNFPKILEIKDNHSYNFKATSKLLEPKKKKKKKKEEEEEHTPSECEISFDMCWGKYPRKAGNKKKAFAEFKKSVLPKGKQGVDEFLKKMEAYVASVDDQQYLQHGETFFRNWQDLEVSDIAPKNANPNDYGRVRI